MTGTLTAPPVDPVIIPLAVWTVLTVAGLLAMAALTIWCIEAGHRGASRRATVLRAVGAGLALLLTAGSFTAGEVAGRQADEYSPVRAAWNEEAAAWLEVTYGVTEGADGVAAMYPAPTDVTVVLGDEVAEGRIEFVHGKPFLMHWVPLEGLVQLPRANTTS